MGIARRVEAAQKSLEALDADLRAAAAAAAGPIDDAAEDIPAYLEAAADAVVEALQALIQVKSQAASAILRGWKDES